MQGHRQPYTEIFIKAITSPEGETFKTDNQPKVFDPVKREERLKQAAAAKKEAKASGEAKPKAKKKVAKKTAAKKTKKAAAKKATGKKKTGKRARSAWGGGSWRDTGSGADLRRRPLAQRDHAPAQPHVRGSGAALAAVLGEPRAGALRRRAEGRRRRRDRPPP